MKNPGAQNQTFFLFPIYFLLFHVRLIEQNRLVFQYSSHQVHQCCFASAIGTKNAKTFPLRYFKTQISDQFFDWPL